MEKNETTKNWYENWEKECKGGERIQDEIAKSKNVKMKAERCMK
jgi:hypothetical protein